MKLKMKWESKLSLHEKFTKNTCKDLLQTICQYFLTGETNSNKSVNIRIQRYTYTVIQRYCHVRTKNILILDQETGTTHQHPGMTIIKHWNHDHLISCTTSREDVETHFYHEQLLRDGDDYY